ncbi:MAG: nickel pincer cofactor biosynthesis protein LarC [Promethearchaeota archaeon]
MSLIHSEKKILLIDCQVAGISGDMILAGLIDLGADFQKIKDKLLTASKLIPDIKNFNINYKKVLKNGICATKIHLSFTEKEQHRHRKNLKSLINKIAAHLNWNDSEIDLASNILNTLIQAEAKIHGTLPDHVHLHETGSFDTIVDIIGFILACQDLNLLENCLWVSTPVAVGGGLLKFSHGLISNPAPATLEILKSKNFEIIGGPIDSELTTPTGAAILVNLAKSTTKFYPPLQLVSVGYGAGTKDLPNTPNVVRLIMGKFVSPNPYNFEQIITIETNIDDVSSEILGNTIKKILDSGFAKDVSVISMTTKKRPGHIIQILTNQENLLPITHILINELGTLGVRFFPSMRYTLNRKIISLPIQISNEKFNISVKVSWDSNRIIIQAKPESDEVLEISQKTSVPMRKIIRIIDKELEKQFPLGEKLNDL